MNLTRRGFLGSLLAATALAPVAKVFPTPSILWAGDSAQWVEGDILQQGSGYVARGAIEYPIGVFTPVTWNGTLSAVLRVGTALSADFVPVSIPAGELFYEHRRGGTAVAA
jgi:hypothetical protein